MADAQLRAQLPNGCFLTCQKPLCRDNGPQSDHVARDQKKGLSAAHPNTTENTSFGSQRAGRGWYGPDRVWEDSSLCDTHAGEVCRALESRAHTLMKSKKRSPFCQSRIKSNLYTQAEGAQPKGWSASSDTGAHT